MTPACSPALGPLPSVPTNSSWPAEALVHAGESLHMLRDSTRVLIRPICRGEAEQARRFIGVLMPRSQRLRLLESFRTGKRPAIGPRNPNVLGVDAAYLAVVAGATPAREIGVARFTADADGDDCEIDVTVADEWHDKGLGQLLVRHLLELARGCGIVAILSTDAPETNLMRGGVDHLHFQLERDAVAGVAPRIR